MCDEFEQLLPASSKICQGDDNTKSTLVPKRKANVKSNIEFKNNEPLSQSLINGSPILST